MNPVIGICDRAVENASLRVVLNTESRVDVIDKCVGYGDVDLDAHRDALINEVMQEATIDQHARAIGAEFAHINGVGIKNQAAPNGAAPDVGAFLAEIEVDAITAIALVFEETILEVVGGDLAEDLLVTGHMTAEHVKRDVIGLPERVDDGRTGSPVIMKIAVFKGADRAIKNLDVTSNGF